MPTKGRRQLEPIIAICNDLAKSVYLDVEFTLDYTSAGYRVESHNRERSHGPRGTPKTVETFLQGVKAALYLVEDSRKKVKVVKPDFKFSEDTYKIVRKHQDLATPDDIIETGLTLQEAQAHCGDPSTQGEGWFDAYYPE